jgi:hypothetical protein
VAREGASCQILPRHTPRRNPLSTAFHTVCANDGRAAHFPRASDHFPDAQTNVVPLHVSMGAYNVMQQSDIHSYWEFNYQGTNWVYPLYELPFTSGFSDNFGKAPDAFQDGEIGALQSIVPGPGPSGEQNKANVVGDNPNLPRDPDKSRAQSGVTESGRGGRRSSRPPRRANDSTVAEKDTVLGHGQFGISRMPARSASPRQAYRPASERAYNARPLR